MKPYLISLAVGLLVGVIYSLLGVKSPAPPTIALIGLLGMLLGEQVVPVAKRIFAGHDLVTYLRTDCAEQILGVPVTKPDGEA
ncbi:DUF1427 family protein [uncultured Sphingomonas sp.]|uniref:DUF1427 family protein n=1 Tax=uncultured Sphingomonas sp. TaxID=158754 RepID=UPI0025D161C2|nr:DUF1427 family protein [uncultured Sphingomonas sp.]